MKTGPRKQVLPEGLGITELGCLPNEWELVRVADAFEVRQGKQLSSKERRHGKTLRPFLRTSNVLWGNIDLTRVSRMPFSDKEFVKLKLREGDILVCEGGEVARTAVWKDELTQCAYQNHIHRLRPRGVELFDNLFFAYWMEHAVKQRKLYVHDANRTTIPNLSSSRLKSFLVPHPALVEQRAIAKVLSAVEEAEKKTEEVIGATKELKKSLMKHFFTYGPVPISDAQKIGVRKTEVGVFPEDWELVRLGDLAEVKYGYRTAIPKKSEEDGVPIIAMGEISPDGHILWAKIRRIRMSDAAITKHTLAKGEVLFNWRNSPNHVGKTAVFEPEDESPYVCASFILRITPIEGVAHSHFVHYFISFLKSTGYFASKSRRAVGQTNFNASVLKALPIPRCSLSTQRKIADMLLAVDSRVEAESRKRASLEWLLSSLLDSLMTGKIRLTDLEL